MNVLFDTSVLIAALIEDHPSHSQSLSWLQRVRLGEIEGFVSTHTIAELYSVLTRIPRQPRINPELAQQLIVENLNSFNKVVLTLNPKDFTRLGEDVRQLVQLPG